MLMIVLTGSFVIQDAKQAKATMDQYEIRRSSLEIQEQLGQGEFGR